MASSSDLVRAYSHCAQVFRRHSRSLWAVSLSLPGGRRRGLHAIYAFARLVDDMADEDASASASERLARLAAIAAALDGGHALVGEEALVVAAAKDTCIRFGLPLDMLVEYVEGTSWDVTRRTYETFLEYEEYLQRVARCGGQLIAVVFGFADKPELRDDASALVVALQLSDDIADASVDFGRGVVHFPLAEMAAAGVTTSDLSDSPEWRRFFRSQAERAGEFVTRAARGTALLSQPYRSLARLQLAACVATLEEVRKRDYSVLSGAVTVSRHLRVLTAARALRDRF